MQKFDYFEIGSIPGILDQQNEVFYLKKSDKTLKPITEKYNSADLDLMKTKTNDDSNN